MDSTNFFRKMEIEWSQEFINKRGSYSKRTFLLIKDYLKPNSKILDVGSDVGINTLNLAKLLPNCDFTGIEPNVRGVKKANALKHKLKVDNIIFVEGDGTKTDFEDEIFDAIICEQVIEHVDKQKELIKEIFRILKKRGMLFITAPNKMFPWEPHINKPFIHWFPKKLMLFFLSKKKKEYCKHLFPISTLKLEKMLKKQGFKPIYIGDRFFDKDIRNVMFGEGFINKSVGLMHFFFKSHIGKGMLKIIFPYNGFVAVK